MVSWSYDGLAYRRRPTRTVLVGDVAVGSAHPIRVQSMTTPATRDTLATVDQIERLVAAGCEIVRLTVPTSTDAENLPAIRQELARRRVRVPLVADIHFTPQAAMKAVEHVEKIRINPGNYADRKRFAVREYSDNEYAAELERIERVFSPLARRARELGVAMRIGTNHGSLSDRIMNRYGDTPRGMVESALEFVRICEAHGYHELVLSMKASNPLVVLHAYRLLCTRMAEESMDYPLHLGVTEAGDGEDGRIKSATGIGPLLEEGIGDTIRVSLTEDPVREIPVAVELVRPYNGRLERRDARAEPGSPVVELRDPYAYERRASRPVTLGPHVVGGDGTILVEVPLRASLDSPAALRAELDAQVGPRVPEETRADVVCVRLERPEQLDELERLRCSLETVAPRVALSATIDALWLERLDESGLRRWLTATHRLHVGLPGVLARPLRDAVSRALSIARDSGRCVLAEIGEPSENACETACAVAELGADGGAVPLILALAPSPGQSPLAANRRLSARLAADGRRPPIVLVDQATVRGSDPLLGPAAMIGGLLCDGIGDAVRIEAGDATAARSLAFSILQAARVRITRTEFISCPSCGRTLFDLEETTARIKARTSHLKGLKIAVMGCVVNGPGEMADADFGYVGWGEGKIALFVGKEMVAKDIPTELADQRLVELIQLHGRWTEPPVPTPSEP